MLVFAAIQTSLDLSAAWPFTTDDAYITFRYGRNLAEGAGLTWNPTGPMVEGYSNFLYVLLSALVIASGMSLAMIKWIGLAALAIRSMVGKAAICS